MDAAARRFRARYGPRALVAGGSLGLGAEFARQLAARGLDLVVVAEAAEPLEERTRALAGEYGVETRAVVVDLGAPDALELLREQTRELEIGLVVYNAAHAPIGRFFEQELADLLRALDVNCRGPLALAHEFGRAMAARGRGGILLMSSVAGFLGSPLIATYAATKAFNLVLGESLWEELRGRGVDVLAFCPGATRTPGYERSGARPAGRLAPPVMEVESVVAEALAALGQRPSAIAGRANRLSAWLLHRLLPRRAAVAAMGRSMRAVYRR